MVLRYLIQTYRGSVRTQLVACLLYIVRDSDWLSDVEVMLWYSIVCKRYLEASVRYISKFYSRFDFYEINLKQKKKKSRVDFCVRRYERYFLHVPRSHLTKDVTKVRLKSDRRIRGISNLQLIYNFLLLLLIKSKNKLTQSNQSSTTINQFCNHVYLSFHI